MSDDRTLDVLFVSPERFRASPQIGVACTMTWEELAAYLSRPSTGEAKDEAGAWSPALYRDNVRRKASLVRIGALVVDIDEGGDVDIAADLVGRFSAIVHETPRCRIVLELAEAIDATTYEATHKIVRAHLGAAGLPADEGAKDASRLSYSPVRRLDAGYRFRTTHGKPLDAHAALAAQPKPKPRPPPAPIAPEHKDAYIRAALRHAAEAVSAASEGIRHYTLCKEAFGLSRLGLSQSEIERALLPVTPTRSAPHRRGANARTNDE
jgi:hypothetical protein